MKRKGFTLIESLAVISIIGILATLTIYVYGSATARSRDARRKSDLTAISLGFQARYDSQTCSDPNDIGFYPGRNFNPSQRWKTVSQIALLTGDCGAFSEYLATVPLNPNDGKGLFPYRFDLSTQEPGGPALVGKHYRLIAHLEEPLSVQEQSDLDRMVTVWVGSFGGANLPPNLTKDRYNYIIGK